MVMSQTQNKFIVKFGYNIMSCVLKVYYNWNKDLFDTFLSCEFFAISKSHTASENPFGHL